MPGEKTEGNTDYEVMPFINKVMKHSGMSYFAALDLPTDTFMFIFRDAVIHEYSQSEEGRAYLEKAKRLNTTEPDWKAIREYQMGHVVQKGSE